MAELSSNASVSSLALQLLILTATRTREVLTAQWSEIDLDAATWTIPGERMKAKREHRVPLSGAAMAILRVLPRIEGTPYIFPGVRHRRPLSNMSLLQRMRSMGYGINGSRGDYVPHGFRSGFRDWCAEQTSFPREVAEAALAHVLTDKTEAAYRRGDLFEKRCRLMEAWAGFVSVSGKTSNVTPIKRAEESG